MSGLWEKRAELAVAKGVVARLRAQIHAAEAERLRGKIKRLPPHQRAVLLALLVDTEDWSEYTYYVGYRSMCSATGLERRQVRRALLALRALGFVEYGKGLWTEDGEPAGSGWRITKDGCGWWWNHEATRTQQPGLLRTLSQEGD